MGGSLDVEPMASSAFGGEVGSSVSRWLLSERSSGKTYCGAVNVNGDLLVCGWTYYVRVARQRGDPSCLETRSVDARFGERRADGRARDPGEHVGLLRRVIRSGQGSR